MTETVSFDNLPNLPLENFVSNPVQESANEKIEPSNDSVKPTNNQTENFVDVAVASEFNPNDEKSSDDHAKETFESCAEAEKKTNADEWLDITGSGNFKKKVIKPGTGPNTRPVRGQSVTVDAKFYLNSILFEEKNNLTFIIGDLDVIQGLELSVCLMEKDETARIMIPSKLAYGKKGRLPEVPEDADIECEIVLREVKTVDLDSLTALERLQLGIAKRERGNQFYDRGEYLEAIHCYEKAAEFLDGIRDCSNNSTEESMEIIETRIKVYNNIAAAHLKLKAPAAALKSVDLVLKVQPKNVKALFRKAKILGIQGSTEDAITCIRIAATLEPQTKIIQNELTRLINKKKKEDLSQRMMYQKMFPQSETKKPSATSKFWKWGMATSGGIAALAVALAAYRHMHG